MQNFEASSIEVVSVAAMHGDDFIVDWICSIVFMAINFHLRDGLLDHNFSVTIGSIVMFSIMSEHAFRDLP